MVLDHGSGTSGPPCGGAAVGQVASKNMDMGSS